MLVSLTLPLPRTESTTNGPSLTSTAFGCVDRLSTTEPFRRSTRSPSLNCSLTSYLKSSFLIECSELRNRACPTASHTTPNCSSMSLM